jgi:integrase
VQKVRLSKKVVEALPTKGTSYFAWDAGDGAVKGFGVSVSPAGKRSFVAQFRIGRGRAARSKRVTIGQFGTWTVEQARERARALIREGEQGIDRDAEARAAREASEEADKAAQRETRLVRDLRLNRLAARFMRDHVRLKRKPATQRFYRMAIARYILPVLGRHDARAISRQEVAKLHASLKDRQATANRVIAVLSAIYGWAEKVEILPDGTRNPTKRLEKFRERPKERFLSIAELERLGAAIRQAETVGIPWQPKAGKHAKHIPKTDQFTRIDPSAAAALRLLIFTGARLREVLDLEWSAVDQDRGLLRLRDSKTGAKTILLNGPARAILNARPRRGRYVFPGESRNGGEQPRADLKRPWALVCKAAGLADVRLHDLRHSFASVGAGEGHGLVVVGKLLGHTQQSTTQRYAHLDADPLRKASDAIATKIAAAMGEAPLPAAAEVLPFRREVR